MMGFRLSPEAEADLDDVWLYVARESSAEIAQSAHRHHHQAILVTCAASPSRTAARSRLAPGLRSFPAGEYVILYRIEGEEVLILHVTRGSRNIAALLED